ncbi:MAG: DegT/DnrJ/EryC1/StrS family aminotransferase [Planctomycetota bacterium]
MAAKKKAAAGARAADGNLAIFGGPKAVPETPAMPQWPWLSDEDVAAGIDEIKKAQKDESYLSAARGGGIMGEFESNLGKLLGVPYVVSTCGGGPALHIAVAACGVQAGDEVIVTPYTWGQSVGCVLQQCAVPVFADIDPETYNLDPASVEKCVTPRTKAIVVVHLYGQPADMDGIMKVAKRHNLRVIEDCAQAAFARYKGKRVGTIGDIGCFSMGSGKNLVGGEGGALVTSNEYFYKKAVAFGMHPGRFRPVVKGVPELETYATSMIYTYRAHPLYCVLANSQLKRVGEMNEWRRKNARHLSSALEGMKLVRPPKEMPDCDHTYHIYAPHFVPKNAKGVTVLDWVKVMKAEGAGVGKGYIGTPFHLQAPFRDRVWWLGKGLPWSLLPVADQRVYKVGDCPVAERICRETEIFISSGSWYRDVRPILDTWIAAFRKVESRLDEIVARLPEIWAMA